MAINIDFSKYPTARVPETTADKKKKTIPIRRVMPWEDPKKLETKPESELESNLRQTEDKLESELRTNLGQVSTNLRQTEDKLESELESNLRQTEDKLESELRTELRTEISFNRLSGLRRNIILCLYSMSEYGRLDSTGPVAIVELANRAQTSLSGARKTLQRLEKEGFISRISFRSGRSGWTEYQLANSLLADLLKRGNLRQTRDTLEPELRPELRTSPSSSSSNVNIYKNTTTTAVDNFLEEWGAISIPSKLQEVGFNSFHLKKIYSEAKEVLTLDQVQESLEQFSYDLEKGYLNIKTKPLNFLLGVLLKNRSPYISEHLLEAQRKELDEYRQKLMELEKAQKELVELEKQKKFESWLEGISTEERRKLVPVNDFVKEGSPIHLRLLKQHWEKKEEPIERNNTI